MAYEFAKGHLIKISKTLLHLSEVKLDYKFFAMMGPILGDQGRKRVMLILFEELIKLQNKTPTDYYLVMGKDSGVSDLRRILRDSNWRLLLSHKDKSIRELGEKIHQEFFAKSSLENSKQPNVSDFYIDNEDFESVLDSFIHLSSFNQFGIKSLLIDQINLITKDLHGQEYPEVFSRLCDVFKLSELQREVLFHYYIFETIDELDTVLGYGSLDVRERKKAIGTLSKIMNVSHGKIKKELRTNSKLAQSLLMEIGDKDIQISDHICEFLQNDDLNQDIFSFFFEPTVTESALSIRHHRVHQSDIDIIKILLQGPQGANILLYGESGTGKTEFTKSIAAKMGLDLYRIKNFDSDCDDIVMSKRSALMAAKNILPKKSILVVDEAEVILESGSTLFRKDKNDNKAWLNSFMEEHQINIIWITNDMTMHPSSKRRFDYSVCFEPFNRKQRLQALKNIQMNTQEEIFTNEELEELSKEYPLEPGALNLAFHKLKGRKIRPENKKAAVKKMLSSQLRLIKGEQVAEKKIESFYNPSFINSSLQEREIIQTIESYYQRKHEVRNLCLLFQGPPGTGKTEYTRYISEKLDRELDIRRASDILSRYWGGTEKQIAQMFREAESNEDILFLDECDSLFRSRANSEYSWMVSETNELLTQMERFQGVLICATNFVDNLDHAAMRRFHLKVRFDTLKSSDLPRVYDSFFSGLLNHKPNPQELQKLSEIKSLTPGDFKAVYNSAVFNLKISHAEIIERLKLEVSYKQERSRIGLYPD